MVLLDRRKLLIFFFEVFGVFSTIPIAAIYIGGRSISVFTLLFAISFIVLLFKRPRFSRMNRPQAEYTLWTVMGLISCGFGYMYFFGDSEWQNAAISFLPKVLLYFVFFILLCGINKDTEQSIIPKSILKGIVIGMTINLVWAVFDTAIYYTAGFSITNTLFIRYIRTNHIRWDMLSIILNGIIRSSGLNNDPANIGIFATLIALYALFQKKYWMFFLSLISILASVSLVALGGVLIDCIVYGFYSRKYKHDVKSGTSLKNIIAISILFICIIAVLLSNNAIIQQTRESVINRVFLKVEIADESQRTEYFLNFIPAMFMNPFSFLIGTGYGTSSYAYLAHGLVTNTRFRPYDPECTIFSYYFDVGLIGFMAYMFMMFNIIKRYRPSSNSTDYVMMAYTGTVGSLIAFLGYHYILYSPVMLISICALSTFDILDDMI